MSRISRSPVSRTRDERRGHGSLRGRGGGAIGGKLVPQLVERGHEVFGTTRSQDKVETLRARASFAETNRLRTEVRTGWSPLLARLVAGEAGVLLMTEARGTSNAKAKRELGGTLRYPSWRQGFAAAYGAATSGFTP